MKPIKNKHKDFEKVVAGEMLSGIIDLVQYDQEHKFKGFQGAEDTIQPAVRLRFKLDGYQYPKYTRWMKFSYHEKSNLYTKFLAKLVENAEPDMDFDIDALNGMKIKTVWSDNRDFQNIDAIYPVGQKINRNAPIPTIDLDEPPEPDIEHGVEEDTPF